MDGCGVGGLPTLTAGSGDTAVGSFAGLTNATGQGNTFLGFAADTNATGTTLANLTNATALGYGAIADFAWQR